jgi:hypothetical protein
MRFKKYLIILGIVLISLVIYYRDHIPSTRSDIINLYYYIFDSVILTEAERNREILLEENVSNQNTPIISDNTSSKGPVRLQSPEATSAQGDNNTNDTQENSINKNADQDLVVKLPDSINNFVPFTSQAPFANWDELHEEACEEASLLMAHYFLEKKGLVLSKEADKDIVDLTKKINKDDITVAEVKKYAEDIYKHSGWKILDNPKAEDIKNALASGKIIIAPMAGRELGNPNFKQPGPLYHMLVISGYDNRKGVFITQDPGTRKGKNYEYKFNVLMSALHDFPGDKSKVGQGTSRILIVVK